MSIKYQWVWYTIGGDMLFFILYFKNSDKAIFADLNNNCVKNDFVLNKAEYPNTFTVVKSLLLKYQPNYSRQYWSQGAGNQLMFTQRGKTVDYEVKAK